MQLKFNNVDIDYTINPVTVQWKRLLFALDEMIDIDTVDLPRGVRDRNGMLEWPGMVELVADVIPGDYSVIMNNLLTSMRQGGNLVINPNGTTSQNQNAARQALEAATNPAVATQRASAAQAALEAAARPQVAFNAAPTLTAQQRLEQAALQPSLTAQQRLEQAALQTSLTAQQRLEQAALQSTGTEAPPNMDAQQRLEAAAQAHVADISLMSAPVPRRRRNGVVEVNASAVLAAYGETLLPKDIMGVNTVGSSTVSIEGGVVWTNSPSTLSTIAAHRMGFTPTQTLLNNLFNPAGGNLDAWGQYCY